MTMTREEITNSQDYKAMKHALSWYPTLTDEERENMDVIDAYADGVIYGWNNPQWIPVEEELPKRINEKSRFSETVLVYNKDGYKETAYYDFEEKIWRWMPSVTHWMKIVPPRKEDKE